MTVDAHLRSDLERWLEPFLAGLAHPARCKMCPLYVAGLIGPGDRKSGQPMAARSGEIGYDQLHQFVSAGVWDSTPLEAALLKEADRLVGDENGFLVIDDTALPKKGDHPVGVAPHYASALGKTANCQSMVSVTLASREVPLMVGLRLFLPVQPPQTGTSHRHSLRQDRHILPRLPQHRGLTPMAEALCQQDLTVGAHGLHWR